MSWTEHRFVSFDGTPVFYHRAAAAEKPKATVMIVHGMGEHGGRYRHLAEYLAAMGFECFAPDLRGFGKSGGKRGCVRRGLDDYLRDLDAVRAIAARDAKELPFFVVGHSFGGLLSSMLAARQRPAPAGLVLTSPIFGIKIPVPAWRHALGIVSSYVVPDYAQPTRVEAGMLTHDTAILAEYGRDPLIHHMISARLYRELVRSFKRKSEIAAAITCPVLLLQSGQDVVVDARKAQEFYALLKSPDKELESYPELYHEILNEVDRARIFSRIGIWISGHLT